jgi:3-ketoacyl-CoA synthase
MLLSNTLFRCGAAAILLSNRAADRGRARFRLLHTVRTHIGRSDESYGAVYQDEDAEGVRGVRLSKQIMNIASDALKRNITNLGPLVLPLSEQLLFFLNLIARKCLRGQVPAPAPLRRAVQAATRVLVALPFISPLVGYCQAPPAEAGAEAEACEATRARGASPAPDASVDTWSLSKEVPPYVPDFTKAFAWVCVHTGGRAVLVCRDRGLLMISARFT